MGKREVYARSTDAGQDSPAIKASITGQPQPRLDELRQAKYEATQSA